MKDSIIIGTRGSNLALWQANAVKSMVRSLYPDFYVEIKVIETKGDKNLQTPLAQIGDKGIFTAEIEQQLSDGSIDFAVHSLKDLPSQLPENMIVAGVLPRAEFRDCLVCNSAKSIFDLTTQDVVATSSLRRKAQLLHKYTTLKVIDIRGNVNTRLKKFDDKYCTAMIMATAGLQRLGYQPRIAAIIPEDEIIPAACQGIVAIECCKNNDEVCKIARSVSDEATMQAAEAERLLLASINGGCKIPFGCYTKFNGNEFFIKAFIASVDGRRYVSCVEKGDVKNALSIVDKVADRLKKNGGNEILQSFC